MPKFLEVTDKTAARAAIEAAHWGSGLNYAEAPDDGVTDARAALQAIIDAAKPGDTIFLPAGKFLISGELVINKPLKIVGCGGRFRPAAVNDPAWLQPGTANTTIVMSSATANGLRVSSPGVILEDFALVNTVATPTAGTGVIFDGSNHYAMSRVTVQGFYDNVRTDGFYWTFDSCHIYSPVRYGILVTQSNLAFGDSGDCGIVNCVLATTRVSSAAAVRWEAGGGVRWTGNKINTADGVGSWQYGIDISIADGVATAEFEIVGGAIAWAKTACFRITHKGPNKNAGIGHMTVSGVVFQGLPPGGVALLVGGGATTNAYLFRELVVSGCSFYAFPAGGIVASGIAGLVVAPCSWSQEDYTNPLITIQNAPQVDIHRQTVTQTQADKTVTIIKDMREFGTQRVLDGLIDYNYKRTVFIDTTFSGIGPNVWVTQFTIEPPNEGGAGVIDVVFSGMEDAWTVPGYQPVLFVKRISRSYQKSNSTAGGPITIATVGTDQLVGTTPYTGLRVVDAGAGKIAVQTQMLTDGSMIRGEIQVNIQGRVQRFSIGPGTANLRETFSAEVEELLGGATTLEGVAPEAPKQIRKPRKKTT